jgi:hypothetical protein
MLRRLLRARSLPTGYLLRRVSEELLAPLIQFAARLGWARGTALLFHAAVHELKPASAAATDGRYRILLLSKAMVTEDVLASFGEDPFCAIDRVSRNAVKALARGFLPANMDENNYVNASPREHARALAYRRFLCRFWPQLARRRRYDAVLTGNFAYFAERELAAALEQLGVAFVVIMKESIKHPAYQAFWTRIYRERRGPFQGRRILVYGKSEREVEIASGIVAPERVSITGMPRLDPIHRMRRELAAQRATPAGPPSVLFFAFGPKAFIPVLVRKRSRWPYRRYTEALEPRLEGAGWYRLVEETQRAIHRLATENPDIRVFIKLKGVAADRDIASLQRSAGVDRMPENIEFVHGGSPREWLAHCDVVCGFNSTALLEALAAGRPVVVPRFAEAADLEMRPFVVDLGDAVDYADDPRALGERLAELARSRVPPSAGLPDTSREVLEAWLFNADGRAGERVRSAVRAEIARNRP